MGLTWGDFFWGSAFWDGLFLPRMIYDRTQTDVDNKTAKGYYNISDLNRVETAAEYIATLLAKEGYVVTITVKKDWAITDFPTATEMQRYVGNIKYCVSQFSDTGISLPNNINGIDFVDANNIEETLVKIDTSVQKMKANYRYCGTITCGGDLL